MVKDWDSLIQGCFEVHRRGSKVGDRDSAEFCTEPPGLLTIPPNESSASAVDHLPIIFLRSINPCSEKNIGVLESVFTGLKELHLEICKLIRDNLSWNLSDNNLRLSLKQRGSISPSYRCVSLHSPSLRSVSSHGRCFPSVPCLHWFPSKTTSMVVAGKSCTPRQACTIPIC